MKKLLKIFSVVMCLAVFTLFATPASAWYAPETGYYEGSGNQVYFFEQGYQPGNGSQYTFVGGSEGGSGGQGGQGGQGGAGGAGGNAIQGQAQGIFGSGNSSNTNVNGQGQSQGIFGSGNSHNENKNTNTNLNTNMNSNKNENTNVNINGGNKQGQAQGQGQRQSADNKGVNQTIVQTYEDKRDLISPPPVAIPEAPLSREKSGEILTKGSLWGMVAKVTEAEVDSMLKCGIFGCDIDVKVRVLFESAPTTEVTLSKTAGAKYLGTIYVLSTGDDMIACEATAIREAMKAGASVIVKLEVDSKVVSQGQSYGVGLGGGASMFGHDDTIAIAPAGGFGFGKAKASNERLPQAMFAIYGK